MIYDKYLYYYPPRPELKIPSESIETFDNGGFLAQPKLNGSCCELYVGPDSVTQKGRHNNTLSNYTLSNREINDIFNNGKWNLIVGEYMNKSKKDENNIVFNHKFVIFDQIVLNNEYLLDSTFEERIKIIESLYKPIDETEFLYKISDNIYMVKTFYKDFEKIYNKLIEIDMFEGLVMKRLNGKLEMGRREKNNVSTQLKVRKPTKNYSY